MESLKDLEINNLTLKEVVIDIDNNKLIVHCLDRKMYKKSYFNYLDYLEHIKDIKEKIIFTMNNGVTIPII